MDSLTHRFAFVKFLGFDGPHSDVFAEIPAPPVIHGSPMGSNPHRSAPYFHSLICSHDADHTMASFGLSNIKKGQGISPGPSFASVRRQKLLERYGHFNRLGCREVVGGIVGQRHALEVCAEAHRATNRRCRTG